MRKCFNFLNILKKFYISQVYAQETITPEYRSTSGYPILKSRDQFKSDAEYYKHVEKIKLKQDKYNENITNFLITIYKKLTESFIPLNLNSNSKGLLFFFDNFEDHLDDFCIIFTFKQSFLYGPIV